MPNTKKKSKTKSKTKSKKKSKTKSKIKSKKKSKINDDLDYPHKLKAYLEKKMQPWYSKLSKGHLLIIFKNGTYKIISSTKWKQYGEDKTIQYIYYGLHRA